jgi:hypothetical protein
MTQPAKPTRFSELTVDKMTDAQKQAAEQILATAKRAEDRKSVV